MCFDSPKPKLLQAARSDAKPYNVLAILFLRYLTEYLPYLLMHRQQLTAWSKQTAFDDLECHGICII